MIAPLKDTKNPNWKMDPQRRETMNTLMRERARASHQEKYRSTIKMMMLAKPGFTPGRIAGKKDSIYPRTTAKARNMESSMILLVFIFTSPRRKDYILRSI